MGITGGRATHASRGTKAKLRGAACPAQAAPLPTPARTAATPAGTPSESAGLRESPQTVQCRCTGIHPAGAGAGARAGGFEARRLPQSDTEAAVQPASIPPAASEQPAYQAVRAEGGPVRDDSDMTRIW